MLNLTFSNVVVFCIFSLFVKFKECCECSRGSILSNFCSAGFVARINFTNVTIIGDSRSFGKYYQYFDIDYIKIYKESDSYKNATEKNLIYTWSPYGECGYTPNKEMAIFGGVAYDGKLIIDICSRDSSWDENLEIQLGQVNESHCHILENNTNLIQTYCISEFVVRARLKDTLPGENKYDIQGYPLGRRTDVIKRIDFKTIYKAEEKFNEISRSRLINIFTLCFNKTDLLEKDADLIIMGYIDDNNTNRTALRVTNCQAIFEWDENIDKLLANDLSNFNCTLISRDDNCYENPYRSDCFSVY